MPLRTTTSHMVGSLTQEGSLLGEVLSVLPTPKTASSPGDLPESDVLKLGSQLGMALHRVAGNVYENPAKRDFWGVKDGALVRLTGSSTEVDDEEQMDPADTEDPEGTLTSILAELEY